MSFRTADLCVTPKIMSRLRMALRLYPTSTSVMVRTDFGQDTERQLSVEELACKILNEHIVLAFPKVIQLEEEVEKLEKQLREK